jgi:hypothetical protein
VTFGLTFLVATATVHVQEVTALKMTAAMKHDRKILMYYGKNTALLNHYEAIATFYLRSDEPLMFGIPF